MKIDIQRSLKFKSYYNKRFTNWLKISIAIGTIAVTVGSPLTNFFTVNKEIATTPLIEDETDISIDIKETFNPFTPISSLPIEEVSQTVYEKDIEKQPSKMIALSFDDGPSPINTLNILNILKENNCTATFFVLGYKVNKYADIINEVYQTGNEIGNHSFNHPYLTTLSDEKIKEEFNDTEEVIYNVINSYPILFRPPYGDVNNKIQELIDSPLIMWSIDSRDWDNISDDEVINNIMSNLEDGKIILMHDIHSRTVEVCKILIPKIKDLDYDIVSISEMSAVKDIELQDGRLYKKLIKR